MSADTTQDVPAGRRRGRPGYDADALLEVAVGVFTRRGYDGTTMDDLARALGLSKSSIYHHVSGKEHLLARALDRALVQLEAVVEQAAGGGGDAGDAAFDRLQTAVRRSVVVLVQDLPFVTLLLRVRGNSDVERAALERRRRIDSRFADLVRAAQDDGRIAADLDPQIVTRLVFGAVNSLTEWYRPGRGVDADAVADTLSRMVFHGIRAD